MGNVPNLLNAYDIEVFLYSAIFFMLIVVIMLFVALVANSIYVEHREATLSRLKKTYSRLIKDSLGSSNFEIERPNKRIEFEALAEVLIQMLESSTQLTEQKLKKYAREAGVIDFYSPMTKSRSWIKRFVAIEKLGLLRSHEIKPLFCSALDREKDSNVIAKIIWALSLIADETDLQTVNNLLDRPYFMSAKFAEYIYANIIEAFKQDNKDDVFVNYMRSIMGNPKVANTLKKAMIEACGVKQFYPAKNVIVEYFYYFNSSAEMKITCLRAIGELDTGDVYSVIKLGLNDKDWRVRAVAAKSASTCSVAVEDLRDALHDDNYHVRINAAKSIALLGKGGISVLKNASTSDDRFVRDVSRYVLKGMGSYV